ncbi:MAG: T9SS type A sorting domain-containing protein, partial [Bacteroidota bacterium]|nr:T9SS type A sorting domain-containing protein [Bacteroidota bacterium]
LLYRPILSLFVIALMALPSLAQQVDWRHSGVAVNVHDARSRGADGTLVHRTPELLRSEEGRAALAEMQRLKELGQLNKTFGTSARLTPGTQRTFQVLDFSGSSPQYFGETFTLMASEARFNIWVANADLAANGGYLVESDWQELSTALGSATPSGSWNPNKGIIEINEEVFGPPSDIDGNGQVEVLVHDIKDQYNPNAGGGLYTSGYYSPSDLTNANKADIIHLDTMPTMFSANGDRKSSDLILQTLAHEYQHLIFAVVNGAGDLTFIDEGLAEWAEVVNGYTPRAISYLSDAGELARSMFDWRETGGYGGPNGEDYQRGGLFHHYLAERLSIPIIGSIAQSTGSGVGNYFRILSDNGLDSSLLRDLVQGYHVANLINDQSLSPTYGYDSPFRSNIRASGYATIDGKLNSSSTTSGDLYPGAVRYLRWSQVGTFSIDISSTSGADHMMPVLIMVPSFGPMERVFPDVSGEPLTLDGNYEDVYLILPHVDLDEPLPTPGSAGERFNVEASWQTFQGTSQFQTTTYDNGQAATTDSGLIIGYGIGGSLDVSTGIDTEWANVVQVPDGAALSSVDVSMLFFSDLSGVTTTSTVKDFTLKIYSDNAGEPGDLILSKEVTYSGGLNIPQLEFQTIDLSGDIDVLQYHQGRVYVSLANAGTDDNYVFIVLAESEVSETPSFLYTQFSNSGLGWAGFDEVQDGSGGSVFDGYVVPIRATVNLIAGATDTEDIDVLPRDLVLEQNYPNPFNPSTQIRFQLPSSSPVTLQVFDLLGRNVATLVDGPMSAGTHEFTFDASSLPSGLYLYTVSTPTQRQTRTMTLIK